MIYLVLIIAVLVVAVIFLIIKVAYLRRGYDELTSDIDDRLEGRTDVPIVISTSDSHARKAANTLNSRLARLSDERLKFEQGNRKVRSSVTNISHDLRTPLTAMTAYLDLLNEEEDEAVRADYLKRIRYCTDTLTDLTGELFEYSKNTDNEYLTGGSKDETTDLNRLMEETLISFYAAFTGKGIKPEIKLPDGPVIIAMSKRTASRIIENIISNAVKYAEGSLEVELDETGRAVFGNPAPELTPVQAGKLFDKYYTVSDGRNSSGLGFSIARELITGNGGSIDAKLIDGRLVITADFRKVS